MSMLAVLSQPQEALQWLRGYAQGTLRSDSREVMPGDVFMAWPGAAVDGRAYVRAALARGAAACIVEQEGVQAFGFTDPRIAVMPGLKAMGGVLASWWFGHPSGDLAVTAITGTNGKTSTAWWLAHAWDQLAHGVHGLRAPCGVVGTLGVGLLPQLRLTGMTTPDPVQLQAAFRHFVDHGAQACAMEASSIGLAEHRLAGTRIQTAVLTNFTQDHLDYHGDMDGYWQAKRALFGWPGLQSAVINIDDPVGARLAAELAGVPEPLDLWTVSVQKPARLYAQDIALMDRGLQFTVVEGGQSCTVHTNVLGVYNVLNLLGVMAVLRSHGCALVDVVGVCAHLQPVPGRMQCLSAEHQPMVVVDYAHTPDALAHLLQTLRPVAQARGGQLWCVFGCGGNRDALKRPLMGRVAQQNADRVVLTSDNPRDEDPARIVADILRGIEPSAAVGTQLHRAEAIAYALAQAQASDVVVVAGKGHEDYQEIAGVRTPFVDAECAQHALAQRGTTPCR